MDKVSVGQRFGRATVISEEKRRGHYRMWLIKCDCGNEKVVYHHCLYSGHTRSCGCLGRERRLAAATKHGNNRRSKKTSEYNSWWEMIQRCYRENHISYKNYGGRGISVCDRWRFSFENFLSDMGRKPTNKHWIDRINNNGDYEPGNCRWSTPRQQLRNTRRNRVVTYNGESMCLAELSDRSGVPYDRLRSRLKSMTPEEAVSKE